MAILVGIGAVVTMFSPLIVIGIVEWLRSLGWGFLPAALIGLVVGSTVGISGLELIVKAFDWAGDN